MKSSNLGTEWDHQVYQGKNWGPFAITIKGPDGLPIDVSNWVFRGSVRKNTESPTVAANIVTTIVNGPAGMITFGMSNEMTAAVPCGPALTDDKSQYVWEYEADNGADFVRSLFFGKMAFKREVAR